MDQKQVDLFLITRLSLLLLLLLLLQASLLSDTLVNYSSFCGNVVDDNKVEQVNVELEMQVDTFTKKVRVCDTNLCNAAGVLGSPRGVALMGVGLVPLLVSIWHSRVFSS